MKDTVILAGFPGVGKSEFFKMCQDSKFEVLDSDSSQYSKHASFPKNYIRHIQENIGKVDYILISTHDSVRKAMEENDIVYAIVYPDKTLKDEYIKRYINRGSPESFINLMINKWDVFIDQIESETFPILIKLSENEYLSNVPTVEFYTKHFPN